MPAFFPRALCLLLAASLLADPVSAGALRAVPSSRPAVPAAVFTDQALFLSLATARRAFTDAGWKLPRLRPSGVKVYAPWAMVGGAITLALPAHREAFQSLGSLLTQEWMNVWVIALSAGLIPLMVQVPAFFKRYLLRPGYANVTEVRHGRFVIGRGLARVMNVIAYYEQRAFLQDVTAGGDRAQAYLTAAFENVRQEKTVRPLVITEAPSPFQARLLELLAAFSTDAVRYDLATLRSLYQPGHLLFPEPLLYSLSQQGIHAAWSHQEQRYIWWLFKTSLTRQPVINRLELIFGNVVQTARSIHQYPYPDAERKALEGIERQALERFLSAVDSKAPHPLRAEEFWVRLSDHGGPHLHAVGNSLAIGPVIHRVFMKVFDTAKRAHDVLDDQDLLRQLIWAQDAIFKQRRLADREAEKDMRATLDHFPDAGKKRRPGGGTPGVKAYAPLAIAGGAITLAVPAHLEAFQLLGSLLTQEWMNVLFIAFSAGLIPLMVQVPAFFKKYLLKPGYADVTEVRDGRFVIGRGLARVMNVIAYYEQRAFLRSIDSGEGDREHAYMAAAFENVRREKKVGPLVMTRDPSPFQDRLLDMLAAFSTDDVRYDPAVLRFLFQPGHILFPERLLYRLSSKGIRAAWSRQEQRYLWWLFKRSIARQPVINELERVFDIIVQTIEEIPEDPFPWTPKGIDRQAYDRFLSVVGPRTHHPLRADEFWARLSDRGGPHEHNSGHSLKMGPVIHRVYMNVLGAAMRAHAVLGDRRLIDRLIWAEREISEQRRLADQDAKKDLWATLDYFPDAGERTPPGGTTARVALSAAVYLGGDVLSQPHLMTIGAVGLLSYIAGAIFRQLQASRRSEIVQPFRRALRAA
jgi:hypothetical protein